jgi:hypothetical protein
MSLQPGKFATMSAWSMSVYGPAFAMDELIRQRPDDLLITLAPVDSMLASPRAVAALEVDARYGFSKERMVCGMGHG